MKRVPISSMSVRASLLLPFFLGLTMGCQPQEDPSAPAGQEGSTELSVTQEQELEASQEVETREVSPQKRSTPALTSEELEASGVGLEGARRQRMSFAQRPGFHGATVLSLGLDARLPDDGGLELWRGRRYDAQSDRLRPAEQTYALASPRLRRGAVAARPLPAPSSTRVEGPRLTRRLGPITEHYDHRHAGLEHSLELTRVPAGEGPLDVVMPMQAADGWRHRVRGDGEAVEIVNDDGDVLFTWTHLVARDATGAALPIRFHEEPGALVYRLEGLDRAELPITIDPLASAPLDTEIGEVAEGRLGFDVSAQGDINGDGHDDLIIGQSFYTDGTQPNEGRALLYLGDPTGFSPMAAWSVEGDQDNALLGLSVAIVADLDADGLDDMVISAFGQDEDPSNPMALTDVGAVYLYQGASAIGDIKLSWEILGANQNDRIGNTLASAGDVNCDGHNDLIIGSYLVNSSRGRASVYHGEDSDPSDPQLGGLSNSAQWSRTGGNITANMGRSASTIGNPLGTQSGGGIDCDGILVGSSGDNNAGGTASGRVELYYGSPSGLTPPGSPDWFYEGSAGFDLLGLSVVGGKDLNADGVPDIAVARNTPTNNGRVDVFYGDATSGYNNTPGWTREENQSGARFGSSMFMLDDVNLDVDSAGAPAPIADLVIGSPRYLANINEEGRIQLFLGSPAGLSLEADWQVTGIQQDQRLGNSISGGDFTGDGLSDVIAGSALYDNDSGPTTLANAGRVDIWAGAPSCFLDGNYLADGEANPDNTCEICDVNTPNDPILGNDGTSCDDNDACTSNTVCQAGQCVTTDPSDLVDCSSLDGVCLVGVCDPADGTCSAETAPDGTTCTDDGLTCTDDVCQAGACQHDLRSDTCLIGGDCYSDGQLSPNDPCELCNPTLSNSTFSTASDGTSCEDGNACTEDETCDAGSCTGGTTINCDDSNECTNDTCSPMIGCQNFAEPNGTLCDDGDLCTTASECQLAVCVGTANVDCSGTGDQCNAGMCDPATGNCTTMPLDGITCDDGNNCTTMDACNSGTCDGTSVDCSSIGDQCNAGMCDPTDGSCTTMPLDGIVCDDGDPCTTTDMCNSGTCAGVTLDCSTLDDQCSAGVCDPSTGTCTTIPANEGGMCDDGDACTTSDSCNMGTCAGTTLDCSSLDDACNAGACDPSTGTCVANPINEGGICDDGDACTNMDACNMGTCEGTNVDCDDGNECTANSCDPATGCESTPVSQGTSCDEMDALSCTAGECDGSGGCGVVVTVGCAIDGACYTDGQENPTNPCEVCDPDTDAQDWTPRMMGEVCQAAECLASGNFQPESTCDGAGTCGNEMVEDCGLYACDGTNGCNTTCADDADCVAMGAFCNVMAGECVSDGTNLAPRADAGPDQNVSAGATVTLDASGSTDPNAGDTLSYQWSFVSSTTGTVPTLMAADTVTATFEMPREPAGSQYTFEVLVSDDAATPLTDTDEVVVAIDDVPNTAPEAMIDGPTMAMPGQMITLSGAGSMDPEGDALTFAWSLTSGAPVPTLSAQDQEDLEVTFPSTIDTETTYVFELNVTDSFGLDADMPAQHQVVVTPMMEMDMGMGDMGMGDMGPGMGDMGTGDMGMGDMDAPSDDMGSGMADMGPGMDDMGPGIDDMDVPSEGDMDVPSEGDMAVQPVDMAPEFEGELQGSSCFCASIDHRQSGTAPTWLLGALLGLVGLLRRRQRS